jgi:flagellar motor switch protein FliM
MEDNMENSNLWDSIQVDMSAEFDKVKVPLGELKSIEDGLIVDLCSVYDNKVSLKVGGKLVASGSLVIINDRFGVRIEHVSESNPASSYNTPAQQQENAEGQDSGEFDYSDFEVENKEG